MGLAASEVTASETRRCAAVSRGAVRVPRAGERLKRSRMGTSAGSASSGLYRISGPRFVSGEPVAFSAPQIGIPAGGGELDPARRCRGSLHSIVDGTSGGGQDLGKGGGLRRPESARAACVRRTPSRLLLLRRRSEEHTSELQ